MPAPPCPRRQRPLDRLFGCRLRRLERGHRRRRRRRGRSRLHPPCRLRLSRGGGRPPSLLRPPSLSGRSGALRPPHRGGGGDGSRGSGGGPFRVGASREAAVGGLLARPQEFRVGRGPGRRTPLAGTLQRKDSGVNDGTCEQGWVRVRVGFAATTAVIIQPRSSYNSAPNFLSAPLGPTALSNANKHASSTAPSAARRPHLRPQSGRRPLSPPSLPGLLSTHIHWQVAPRMGHRRGRRECPPRQRRRRRTRVGPAQARGVAAPGRRGPRQGQGPQPTKGGGGGCQQ